jgi:hypothetical protein
MERSRKESLLLVLKHQIGIENEMYLSLIPHDRPSEK